MKHGNTTAGLSPAAVAPKSTARTAGQVRDLAAFVRLREQILIRLTL